MQDSLLQIEAYFSTCMLSLVVIVILIAVIFAKIKSIHNEMERMRVFNGNMIDTWLTTDIRSRQMDAALTWYLRKKHLKIVPDKNHEGCFVIVPKEKVHKKKVSITVKLSKH